MGIIDLPVVSADARLEAAFALMRNNRRSGVLMYDGPRLILFNARAIAGGINRQKTQFSELTGGIVVGVLPEAEAAEDGVDSTYPGISPMAIANLMVHLDFEYAQTARLPLGQDTAEIITASELQEAALRTPPSDCYCRNPNIPEPHEYSPSQAAQLNLCNKCGASIVCYS